MAEQGKGFAGLLGNVFGTTPPAYMEGLLGQQATEDLRKRSIGTGIANALLGYAAMPKNRNLGLGRILAGAAQAGIGGARGVYDNAKTDYLQGQAIEQAKRKQEQDAAQQEYIQKYAAGLPADQQAAVRAFPQLGEDLAKKQFSSPEYELVEVGDSYITVDKNTKKPVAGVAPIPKTNTTNDITNYERYKKDEMAAGRQPRSFNEWNLQTKKAGAGNINLPADQLPVGQTGANEIDKALLSSGDRLMRLNRVRLGFKPEYQNVLWRTQAAFSAFKDKIGQASPEEKTLLAGFATYKQDAIQELNAYINEITGAAIGQGEEAARIKQGMPNVGSGMFDGDSPEQFEAKLKNTMESLRQAEARLHYIKRNGFKITDVPLSRMPSIISKEAAEIIRRDNLDTKNNLTHKRLLQNELAAKFGLLN